MLLLLVGLIAGWLADEMWVDFKTFKIFYRLNYLDFYFLHCLILYDSNVYAFQPVFLN